MLIVPACQSTCNFAGLFARSLPDSDRIPRSPAVIKIHKYKGKCLKCTVFNLFSVGRFLGRIRGRELGVLSLYAGIGCACFGLEIAETSKKVRVPSGKIGGLLDHLESFPLTSL